MNTKQLQQPADSQRVLRYQPLVVVFCAVAMGIILDRVVAPSLLAWWGLLLAGIALWPIARRLGRDRVAMIILLIGMTAIGGLWGHLRWRLFPADNASLALEQYTAPACIEVVASAAPVLLPEQPPSPMLPFDRQRMTRMPVRATGIRDDTTWRPVSGRGVLLVFGEVDGVRAGDRVRIFGYLQRPEAPGNPGEFDYGAFARADRRLFSLRADSPAALELQPRTGWLSPMSMLARARAYFTGVLMRRISPERSPLAAAVLLGSRDHLETQRRQAYFEVGAIHLLVVSGLHIAILVMIPMFAMRLGWLPRRATLISIIVIAILYALLTEVRLPVVRAVVLIVVVCVGTLLTRRPVGFNSLALAALIVLAINPSDLFRVGPQLSFLAVSTILVFVAHRKDRTPLDRLLAEYEKARPTFARMLSGGAQSAARLFLLGLVIWLVACPLVMARFHLFSPIGIVVTFAAIPFMFFALNFGFATMVTDTVCPPLANLAGKLCDGSLWCLESIIHWGQAVPFGHFWVPGPASWWLIVFYGGLAFYVARPAWRPAIRWRVVIVVGWVAIGAAVALASSPAFSPQRAKTLRCTFLSVGHGSAVVIETPDGKTLLYDAGSLGSPDKTARRIGGYLWSRGITHIDAAILSHADVDHYNAIPDLLEKFDIGVVYISPVMFYEEKYTLGALRKSLSEHNVPTREVFAGDRLATDDKLTIAILHPGRRGAIGGDNANSIVLAIEYAGQRILLPGDLEENGMADLIAEQVLPCDVIAAPHHGSLRSSPEEFVDWSTPQHVVISGGRSRHAHMAEEAYRTAGANVLHTSKAGAVTVTVTPAGLEIEPFLQSP